MKHTEKHSPHFLAYAKAHKAFLVLLKKDVANGLKFYSPETYKARNELDALEAVLYTR